MRANTVSSLTASDSDRRSWILPAGLIGSTHLTQAAAIMLRKGVDGEAWFELEGRPEEIALNPLGQDSQPAQWRVVGQPSSVLRLAMCAFLIVRDLPGGDGTTSHLGARRGDWIARPQAILAGHDSSNCTRDKRLSAFDVLRAALPEAQ